MNAGVITGNLTDDPELRFTQDGRPVASLTIGNSERQGNTDYNNGFFDITVWGPQAEHVAATLRKGERVVVGYRLQQTSWEREDGSRGYRTRLIANAVGLSLEFGKARRIQEPREAPVAAAPPQEEPAPL